MDMFKTITSAGITLVEAARLFEVSRPTIYNWYKGMTPKNASIYNRAVETCGHIAKATESGHLPLPAGLSRDVRWSRINQALMLAAQELLTL